ncbi:U4/U6 small nuclear ribonucleoprotein [Cordyceps militaris CM01]|uniref:U4/U6 small nuclear ribonucleoprotein n=2 Tax=Cordyceps militaris TaxID=73501 RepID=G3JPU8_CORMM|nr:U4/U6 small nuclear ribonucleoprotein [Cordyceps militaris CM01]ATY67200.1 U4 U6 small nuclear ribonucleo [Cordyceps militaris]EGX89199.1 U4/U6 small nuclear ribonucleoprotein [Cordyceps militaris CM01]
MERQSQSLGLGPRHESSLRIQKPESASDRLAALKARVAAATATSKAKGGLNVGLHPALEDLGSWKPQGKERRLSNTGRNTPYGSKEAPAATVRGSAGSNTGQHNPYIDESAAVQPYSSRTREPKRLVFNQKGKYIQQANALRRQEALEAMKKRIAEQTRKAGIDEDLDTEKNFLVEEPPLVEWWDEGLIDGDSYDIIELADRLKIASPDSIITEYVQHPVPLEPPQDRLAPAPKAMYLTSKEQAKIRRQRRMAEGKEMQAKIRLGLVPAPPPKVKKGNLMRVLGDVAVKDPTAVEARVNREIAERHQKHVDTNEERKLNKDQKHDKLVANQQKDLEKGVHVLVLKINSLANGQHRYKIGVNAEQYYLTGTCIMHPKFNLLVVEGGAWAISKYKKLMLNRIDWTENAPSRDRDGKDATRDWLLAEDAKGELKDMSLNRCTLVWEGEQKARGFRKWGSKVCETDAEARDALSRAKLENFWTLAKGMA